MLRQMCLRLWREERGSASPEWALVATILVLGAITGLIACRQATLTGDHEPTIAAARQ